MEGSLHPSFRAYIDCFHSQPFPKMFPRGGGPHDQDPMLMRDFRMIRKMELQLKETQEKMESIKSGQPDPSAIQGGGEFAGGLEDVLEQYLEDQGEDGTF